MRFAADGRRIPDESTVFFRRIAPCGLAGGQALGHHRLRLTQQNRDVLLRMQSVADEKRHHHQVLCPRQRITIGNTRQFLQINRVDAGIKPERPEPFDLPLGGLAGLFIPVRAVTGNEQRDVLRLRRARKGKLFDDPFGACQNDFRHAFVSAHRTAVNPG